MLVYIEDIQQNLSLSTGEVEAFVRLKLPTGEVISVPVDDTQIRAILAASTGVPNDAPYEEPAPEIYPEQEVQQTEVPDGQDDLVNWENLPTTVLSDQMKQILREVGAAPEMPMRDLVTLVEDISERMLQQAQERVQAEEPPRAAQMPTDPQYASWPAKPQVQPKKPAQRQKVNQPVGRVIVPQAPPIRSVQKDEMGYPVVPGMVSGDPGEVPAFGDEDGVGQIS